MDGSGKVTRQAEISNGTLPTLDSMSSCAIKGGASSPVGSATEGTFFVNGACAGGTFIFNLTVTAPNRWACTASDMTTAADYTKINQTNYTTSSVTFTATALGNDQITWSCTGF